MKAVVAAFNQEKALVGAFSVITNLRMELFQALVKARRDESYVSPLDSRGSARVVDKAAAAEEEWRDKLSGECEDEYEHSVGKFEQFTSFSEPSSETYDDWTERIYREFSSKRNKHRNLEQEHSAPEQ